MSFVEKLISVANRNDATKNLINEENARRLEALSSHMLEVNKTLNLTAIKDEDGVILKHLVDQKKRVQKQRSQLFNDLVGYCHISFCDIPRLE